MTAPSDYLIAARLRPDRLHLYAPGRADWPSINPPPPPPPPPTGTAAQIRLYGIYGKAVYVDPSPPAPRDALVPGVDMPIRTNTGVPDRRLVAAGGPMVEVSTAQTLTGFTTATAAAAAPIVDKWYTSKVSITSGYLVFKRCQFNGDPVTVGPCVQTTNVAVQQVQFYDCDFWAQAPQWDNPAVKGHHVELYRCYIRGCTDGIAHIGVGGASYTGIDQNIVMQQCLIELMCYLSPDQGAAGGLPDNASHLDCVVQFRGGNNLLVWGNRVIAYFDPTIGDGGKLPINLPSGTHLTGDKYAVAPTYPNGPSLYATSCFMFSPILGTLNNIRIRDNWFVGATVTTNFAGHSTVGPLGVQITGNRVALKHRVSPTAHWLMLSAMPCTISGNVVWTVDNWDLTNPAAPIYLPDALGTVTTTAANNRTNG